MAASSSNFHSEKSCNYCKQPGHLIFECRKLQRKKEEQSTQFKTFPCRSAATTDSASTSISLNDLQAILNQITGHSTTSSLAATPGMHSSWFFDSGCYNHMTSSAGLEVLFSNPGGRVQDSLSGRIVGTGRKVGRFYEAISMKIPIPTHMHYAAAHSPDVWHSRLGHTSSDGLQSLISRGVLGQVKQNKVDCVSCKLAKHHALPFNSGNSTSNAPFDLVHSDIWGPHRLHL